MTSPPGAGLTTERLASGSDAVWAGSAEDSGSVELVCSPGSFPATDANGESLAEFAALGSVRFSPVRLSAATGMEIAIMTKTFNMPPPARGIPKGKIVFPDHHW